MRAWIPAILAALVLHAAILLFGGIFFLDREEPGPRVVEEVDLLTVESEEPQDEQALVETPSAQPPPVLEPPPEVVEPVEATTEIPGEPRLDALSLGALAAALDEAANGTSGGDAFGAPAGLASGGTIGGTGLRGAGSSDSPADVIFDISQLDQRPRPIHQAAPTYPRELRQRRIEGTVYVVFVVDTDGRVLEPRVEEATDEAFRGPALEAVRRWRFEPAVVRGAKVRSKLRVPIRFALNG